MLEKYFTLAASLIVLAVCTSTQAQSQPAAPGSRQQAEKERRPEYPTIHVTDLHCKNCAKRLARKLFTVPGVTKVKAQLKNDLVIVIPQKNKAISPLALWKAAEAAKFKVVKLETPRQTFDKKPVELAKRKSTGAPASPRQ